MRDLKFFGLFLALIPACKTQRPTVDIERRGRPESGILMNVEDEDTGRAPASLKISALSFPLEAIPYTRIMVVLQAPGKGERTISNYMLKSEIPIEAGIKYALTITAFKSGAPIYSNQYCKNSNKFTSKSGVNNYTVPMCALPEIAAPAVAP